MIEINTVVFLLLVAVGAIVQTVSGFAMGLIIIAGATLFGLHQVAFSAAVIGIISLLNSSMALRTTHRSIDRQLLFTMTVTLLPGLVAGVLLLDYLSSVHYATLRFLLGLITVVAGLVFMLKPALYECRSSTWVTAIYGWFGGVIGGLYSAGGAAMAYHLYRQPVSVAAIRATLLALFVLSTAVRTFLIAVAGQLTVDILLTSALAVPLVVIATEVTSRYLNEIPDAFVRKLVFVLMTGVGAVLITTTFI